ncbi:hypothetical protein GOODEAATRI_012725, partial [Goodea atripinnis]
MRSLVSPLELFSALLYRHLCSVGTVNECRRYHFSLNKLTYFLLHSLSFYLFFLTSFCLPFRYKAIVNPMDIQTSSAVFWTCLKAVSIWLLSVLLAVPEAIFSQVVSMQMHPKIHSVMIFLVYFLIPLTIISVYYYHIARTLIKSAHEMPGEVSEHTKRQVHFFSIQHGVGFSAFYCWTSLEIGR